jgi:ArsR family transcriptional regulator
VLVDQLKALADETRLHIITILRKYELTVNELVSVLQMGQSRVSRHLKILLDSGLIVNRREGLHVYYSYTKSESAVVIEYLSPLIDSSMTPEDEKSCEKELLKRKEGTRRFFDEIASQWAQLKDEILGDFDIFDELLSGEGSENWKSIADFGCGNGDFLETLTERMPGKKLIGVDYSPAMLQVAKERFQGSISPDLRIGDLEHLPMGDGEIECGVMQLVLHHLPEPGAVIKEVFRVLKGGGVFFFVDFDTHDHRELCTRFGDRWPGFSLESIRSWTGNAGFKERLYRRRKIRKELYLHMIVLTK